VSPLQKPMVTVGSTIGLLQGLNVLPGWSTAISAGLVLAALPLYATWRHEVYR
jgi:hypothetical protein